MNDYYVLLVFTSLSAVALITIIPVLLILKNEIIVKDSKYVIVLLILDLLLDLTYMIPSPVISSEKFCILQGYMNEFFSLTEVVWTGVISLSLYYEIKMEKGPNSFPFYKSLIMVLVLTFSISLIVYLNDLYKLNGQWCTISPNTLEGKLAAMFCYYFVLWIVITWNFISYSQIKNTLKPICLNFDEGRSKLRRINLYLLGLPLFYTPLSIVRIIQVLGGTPEKWFLILSGCIARSIGIYNAMVYGLDRHVRNAIKQKFKRNKIQLI